jgi:hypothetical protein
MTIPIWVIFACHLVISADRADDTILEQKIGEIFSHRCVSCHNTNDQAGGLSLETAAELRAGGYLDTKSVAQPLLSLLIEQDGQPPSMPKDGHPLTKEELSLVQEWLQAGSPWSEDHRVAPAVVQDFSWWSLAALNRPPVPDIHTLAKLSRNPLDQDGQIWTAKAWVRNPIDLFVWQEYERRGLAPSQEADRRTLIRRLSYDLTGLPPTTAEIQAFENDPRPDAYEQLVESLLASPRYGERGARHWLDIARYADTAGYDKDKLRTHAWPYRDYVIRAFNDDKPYSQFVEEQVAGDVLYPNSPDGIVGLGFLAAGPWDFIGHVEVPESKFDGMEARNLDRDEMVSATMNVFCSTTVQCARCHHHKFDPITSAQYYGLQAVFAAVDRANRPFDIAPSVSIRRKQLEAELTEVVNQLKTLEAEMTAEGGERLIELRTQLQVLETAAKAPTPTLWPDAYGYHSQLSQSQTEEKWIEWNFAEPVVLKRIVIHPCHDEFGGIGAGFGFPNQLTVSIRQHDSDAWQVWAESRDTAAVRVPHGPLEFEPKDGSVPVSSLRISSSNLAWRQDAWIMALAEVEIWNSQDQNVASNGKLHAKDSIEAAPRWQLTNVTDGLWPQYAESQPVHSGNIADELQRVRAQLTDLETELRTPARVTSLELLHAAQARIQQHLTELPPRGQVFAAATSFVSEGNFRPTLGIPRPVQVLHRGSVGHPLEEAIPGTISLTKNDRYQFRHESLESDEGWRRAQLARWITNPDNPLTWRSIVNRLWLWHFGRPIVDSPNDFGRMGQLPTHPELLDWLAAQFRSNQSFKSLTRLMVTSATYRQASLDNERFLKIDAENSGYWKFNRRRLSAEEVRDSMLMVAGCLNETMGGPGYYLFEIDRPEHSPHFEYQKFNPDDPSTHRRSIYRFVVRSQPDPWITTMDGADCSQSVAKRDETITPMQALSLLNNDFTLMVARQMAGRLTREHAELEQQVRRGFELVSGRLPSEAELRSLSNYAQEHGLANLCRVVVNLSEFVFVD